jgi:anaerobic C4-dicarboxylate transporter
MSTEIALQFALVLVAVWMSARYSGMDLSSWSAVVLLVLLIVLLIKVTPPSFDVMSFVRAMIMAASGM